MESDRPILEKQPSAPLNILFTQALLIEACICFQEITKKQGPTHCFIYIYSLIHSVASFWGAPKTTAVWQNSPATNPASVKVVMFSLVLIQLYGHLWAADCAAVQLYCVILKGFLLFTLFQILWTKWEKHWNTLVAMRLVWFLILSFKIIFRQL